MGRGYLALYRAWAGQTCLYSSDMAYGLVVDALGEDPSLDPYPPESQITDPLARQTLTSCNTYTIQGTADDYYSGVTAGGREHRQRQYLAAGPGHDQLDLRLDIPGDGTYTLLSRARDAAFNLEQPTSSVIVVVNGCTVTTVTPPPAIRHCPATPLRVRPPAPARPTPTSTMVPPTATASTTPTVCPIQFADVPSSNPFYSYIRCLACQGILNGYSTSPPVRRAARPASSPAPTSRAGQAAKIVANAAGYTDAIPSTQQTFTDVPPAIPSGCTSSGRPPCIACTAAATPPSRPRPATVPYFLPFANVTRGQMAKIDANAAGLNSPVPIDAANVRGCAAQQPLLGRTSNGWRRCRSSAATCNQAPGGPCVAPDQPALFPGRQPRDARPSGQNRRQYLLPRLRHTAAIECLPS